MASLSFSGYQVRYTTTKPANGIFSLVTPGVAKTEADEIRVTRAGRKNMAGRDTDSCGYRVVKELLCIHVLR